VTCQLCGHFLIAEKQKDMVYYRCHTKQCPQKTIREDGIESRLLETYKKLQFTHEEFEYLQAEARRFQDDEPKRVEAAKNQLLMELTQIETRLAKLADAYMDEVFDKETYAVKKSELILKQQQIKEKLLAEDATEDRILKQLGEFLELVKSVYLSYKSANEQEKREMVQISTSNFTAKGKSLSIKLKKPFQTVFERPSVPVGSPTLATSRTLSALLRELLKYFGSQPFFEGSGRSDKSEAVRPGFLKILENKTRSPRTSSQLIRVRKFESDVHRGATV
jgi:hypothetical protein